MIYWLPPFLGRVFQENARQIHQTAKEMQRSRLKKRLKSVLTTAPSQYAFPSIVRWAKLNQTENDYWLADFYHYHEGQNQWAVSLTNQKVYPAPGTQMSDYESGNYYLCIWARSRWTVLKAACDSEVSYQWAAISQTPEYDSSYDYYLAKKLVLIDNEWQWDQSEEIEIKRAIGYEGYEDNEAKDIRNWVPWWPVNSIVRIIERWDDVDNQMRWFIAEPMIYAGKPETATLRHHPTDGIVQCVWQ